MSASALDKLTFLSSTGRKAAEHLAEHLVRGEVVLFAGAGLSRNAPSKGPVEHEMPTWNQLGEILLSKLESTFKDTPDVLKIADYYQTAFGRTALVNALRDAIRDEQHDPGRVHRHIAQLNFREIVTTNFDTLIERAFRAIHLSPQVVVTGEDLTTRGVAPRIIKMNGSLDRNPHEVVITGDDFLVYSDTHPLVEAFVTKTFVESKVLFVGF
ncbi:MAG TPA: SIR2 family protein, partial [Thermoanaerobaculia bacterium]|nr:SIR2 family protein [Thermoanaerobaculia bacterium]